MCRKRSIDRFVKLDALRQVADNLKAHLDAFITAYNYAKHLKSLRWRTPFQAISQPRRISPWPFFWAARLRIAMICFTKKRLQSGTARPEVRKPV